MKNHIHIVFLFSQLFLILSLGGFVSCTKETKVYVVYLGEHNGDKTLKEIEDHHCSFLHSVKATSSKEHVRASLVHSYKNVINGFSALLTPQEADMISGMEGVISVFHSDPHTIKPHTTRSWDFVKLLEGTSLINSEEELLQNANYGEDIIVGVLDSGVWPESSSFNDEGMGPVPKSWNGTCQEGVAFNASHCNRKLIGAQYYLNGYEAHYGPLDETREFRSPRDVDGHGTHTASTVGGRRVANASAIGGFAKGTAAGGAPNVRLAIYKVCWPLPNDTKLTCLPDDVLAAFDDAIANGVHVLSISLGFSPVTTTYYTEDPIAIGSLNAVKRNIVVACSAGNDGPTPSTVGNVAPWIITVGASSIDRVFSSPIMLGNGMIVEGETVTPIMRRKLHPLVYAGDVEITGNTTSNATGECLPGTLSKNLVRGKVVICINSTPQASMEVNRAGGVAAILLNPFNEIQVIPFLDPTTVAFLDGINTILAYIRSEKNPMATLLPGKTLIGTKPAPVMAPFSSKGPNLIDPNILKPDITAPGFNILAAWTEASSLLKIPEDRRFVKYNIQSGTSMSCPHVAAVIALLKSIHPDWSSAAIRSALMTTSTINNVVGRPITNATGDNANPFEYGAGHFKPSRAVDPGLVYDATYTDYLLYLCSQNISLDSSFSCPEKVPAASNLNYPSLAIANMRGSSRTVTRVVTNVGKHNSTYVLTLRSPPGYVVDIVPKTLRFSKLGEKHSFNITVTAQSSTKSRNEFSFGWYTWSDGVHMVRSPIAVSSSAA
ncbi:subtilisin-like protease SBT5.6 [Solanum dulcamara]|uniref:subtilisin-like protease SBT5.6 n=1 Tax=Solanum dulcamara TaxID=45834 RepID=UPI00248683A3|nr:subtilisin-like protease SBT5.6 [Solanum dulcamara]